MRDPRDDAAFTGFVCDVAAPLLRTAWLLTGERWAAEELLGTSLAAAYRAWPGWAPGGDREAAVLRLLVAEHLRGRRSGRADRSVLALPLEPFEPLAPSDARTAARRTEATRQALRRLPARTRAVLVLRLSDDLDEIRAARTLGVRRRTVRTELPRALEAMPAPGDPAADQEADVRERLADLADDVPPADPLRYAEAARARHEHRRASVTGIAAVLVLLAVVAVPLAFRLVSTAVPAAAPAPSPTVQGPAPAPAAAPFDPSTRPGSAELITRFGVAGASYGFLQNCLFGSGVEVSVHPDGSFVTTPRPGQDGLDAALVGSCFDRLSSTVPISEQARALLVADWTDTYLCLVVRGWTTAPEPPPDLTLSSGLLTWNPYEGIDPLELGAARSTCPVRTY